MAVLAGVLQHNRPLADIANGARPYPHSMDQADAEILCVEVSLVLSFTSQAHGSFVSARRTGTSRMLVHRMLREQSLRQCDS